MNEQTIKEFITRIVETRHEMNWLAEEQAKQIVQDIIKATKESIDENMKPC